MQNAHRRDNLHIHSARSEFRLRHFDRANLGAEILPVCSTSYYRREREDDRLIPTGKWHLLAYLAAEKEFYRAFV